MSHSTKFERRPSMSLKLASAGTTAALLMVLATPGLADGARMKSSHADWADTLELTPEQRAAMAEGMREARREYRQAASAARETGDRAGMAELRRAQATSMRATVAEVLSEAQLAELRAQRQAHGERRFERLAEDLELHSSQRDAVREALESGRASAADGAAKPGRWGHRGHAEAVREQLAGTLTPDQLARWDDRMDRSDRAEQRLDRHMARLTDSLALHSSQVDPVREILAEGMQARRDSWRAIMKDARDGGHERAEMRARGDVLRAETRERLSAVLTPQQLADFDALRADRAERPAGGRQGSWGERRGPRSRS